MRINNIPLSDQVTKYWACSSCHKVEFEETACSRCGGKNGGLHFEPAMRMVVDLLEDAYTVGENFEYAAADPESGGYYPGRSRDSSYLAAVLFFCTLGEILLEHLIEPKMVRLDLPEELQRRLLDDNLGIKSRIQKLFPAMFDGVTFNEALARVSRSTDTDYKKTVVIYREANDFRNHLLHKGAAWKLDDRLPDKCFGAVRDLLGMYAAIHNELLEPYMNSE